MKLFQAYDGSNSARLVLAENAAQAVRLVLEFEAKRYPEDDEDEWEVTEVPMVAEGVSAQLDNHGDMVYFYDGL